MRSAGAPSKLGPESHCDHPEARVGRRNLGQGRAERVVPVGQSMISEKSITVLGRHRLARHRGSACLRNKSCGSRARVKSDLRGPVIRNEPPWIRSLNPLNEIFGQLASSAGVPPFPNPWPEVNETRDVLDLRPEDLVRDRPTLVKILDHFRSLNRCMAPEPELHPVLLGERPRILEPGANGSRQVLALGGETLNSGTCRLPRLHGRCFLCGCALSHLQRQVNQCYEDGQGADYLPDCSDGFPVHPVTLPTIQRLFATRDTTRHGRRSSPGHRLRSREQRCPTRFDLRATARQRAAWPRQQLDE